MTRAVIYARQSLDATGDAAGVDRQRAACQQLCEARGWTVVETCVDNSISAYSGKPRPGWERALQLARTRAVDVIVAWHVDRLTRSMLDLEALVQLAETSGVRVVTASGDLDLTTDAGRLVARILASVARGESERKASRQRLANATRAEAGWAPPGPRPIGYRRVDGTYEIVEAEAAAIREGAEAVLAGMPLAAVAKAWTEAGLRTSQGGRPWRADGVRKALLSPRYTGARTHRGQVVAEGAWPAILAQETHAALVARLTDPARRTTWYAGGAATTLLTGIARCARCGGTVAGSRVNGRYTYRCFPNNHLTLPRDPVDKVVDRYVVARLSRADAADFLADRGEDVEGLRAEAVALRRRLDVLAAAFADGTVSEGQLRAGSSRLRAQLETVDTRLADAGKVDMLSDLVGNVDVATAWKGAGLAQRRAVVAALFDVELVPPGRGVQRFRDETVRVSPKGVPSGGTC